MGRKSWFCGALFSGGEAAVLSPQIKGLRLASDTGAAAHNILVELDIGCGHESVGIDLKKFNMEISQVLVKSGVSYLVRALAHARSTPAHVTGKRRRPTENYY